jgi:hypothetical protein
MKDTKVNFVLGQPPPVSKAGQFYWDLGCLAQPYLVTKLLPRGLTLAKSHSAKPANFKRLVAT